MSAAKKGNAPVEVLGQTYEKGHGQSQISRIAQLDEGETFED